MTLHFNQASPGAPVLSGLAGALVAILDWALPQAGWTIKYSSGQARIYESVNGELLHANDSATGMCTVRGVESATGATAFVDPYPTVAQHAESVWRKSNLTSSAARNFDLVVSDDHILFVAEYNSDGTSDIGAFGRPFAAEDDEHASYMLSRKTSSGTSSLDSLTLAVPGTSLAGTTSLHWKRDVSGAIKSSLGQVYASGIRLGNVPGTPAARAGYRNRVVREPVAISDAASLTTTPGVLGLSRRGFIPNLWSGVHTGPDTLTAAHIFSDVAYNPAARFKPFLGTASGGVVTWGILEITDTWVPY